MSIATHVRRILSESYNQELVDLIWYFKNKPLELVNLWHWFDDWPGSEDIMGRLDEKGVERVETEKMYDDGDYEYAFAVEEEMTEDEKRDFASYVTYKDSSETPSWSVMEFERVLPPPTWLVHKTDDTWGIRKRGFKHGESEVERIAYTTHKLRRNGSGPGYNFAFKAGDEDPSKYGRHAVMFQAAAVQCYHYGDEEQQCVFWGPSISPKSIISIDYEENFHDDRSWVVDTHYGNPVRFEELEYAVGWVQKNLDQYRKALGYGKGTRASR